MRITFREAVLHISLFIVTFATTTIAGAEWMYGKSLVIFAKEGIFINGDFTWADFISGMPYSFPFLFILTVHEFGHYFTARAHRVDTTLPYYIPLPLPMTFGTLGALIRIKSSVESKKQHFDIGVAGPLAGFVATLIVLLYGFTHLPSAGYIFQIHPEYAKYGLNYTQHVYDASYFKNLPMGGFDVIIGKSLLFTFFEKYVGDPALIPNAHEIMHYPYLFAGFLSLVFTSINLLPIGQLDGGHVVYGLLGYKGHRTVATIFFLLFLFYSGLGVDYTQVLFWTVPELAGIIFYLGFFYLCLTGLRLQWKDTLMYTCIVFTAQFVLAKFIPGIHGYSGWLLFAFLIGRFIGVTHPPSRIEEPLNTTRQIIGWIAILIFILSFTPAPIELFEYPGTTVAP